MDVIDILVPCGVCVCVRDEYDISFLREDPHMDVTEAGAVFLSNAFRKNVWLNFLLFGEYCSTSDWSDCAFLCVHFLAELSW